MKRNNIVMEREGASGTFAPYGRINRVNKDGTVQVIFCTKDFGDYKPEDLILIKDYKGYYVFDFAHHWTDEEMKQYANRTYRRMPRYHRMPKLPELQRAARRYVPDADF